MFYAIAEGLRDLIGLDEDGLSVWEMCLRALIVYVIAIMLVKVGQKRFMGKNTAFDVILGIILGSVLSRAITGNAPFFPTLGAGAVLVALHWLFSVASFHSHAFGTLIKGHERLLVRDGEILWDNMRKSHISRHDLEMAIRNNGALTEVGDVKLAHFERNGEISIIPREQERKVRVVDVPVQEGVQVVRIELG